MAVNAYTVFGGPGNPFNTSFWTGLDDSAFGGTTTSKITYNTNGEKMTFFGTLAAAPAGSDSPNRGFATVHTIGHPSYIWDFDNDGVAILADPGDGRTWRLTLANSVPPPDNETAGVSGDHDPYWTGRLEEDYFKMLQYEATFKALTRDQAIKQPAPVINLFSDHKYTQPIPGVVLLPWSAFKPMMGGKPAPAGSPALSLYGINRISVVLRATDNNNEGGDFSLGIGWIAPYYFKV